MVLGKITMKGNSTAIIPRMKDVFFQKDCSTYKNVTIWRARKTEESFKREQKREMTMKIKGVKGSKVKRPNTIDWKKLFRMSHFTKAKAWSTASW